MLFRTKRPSQQKLRSTRSMVESEVDIVTVVVVVVMMITAVVMKSGGGDDAATLRPL